MRPCPVTHPPAEPAASESSGKAADSDRAGPAACHRTPWHAGGAGGTLPQASLINYAGTTVSPCGSRGVQFQRPAAIESGWPENHGGWGGARPAPGRESLGASPGEPSPGLVGAEPPGSLATALGVGGSLRTSQGGEAALGPGPATANTTRQPLRRPGRVRVAADLAGPLTGGPGVAATDPGRAGAGGFRFIAVPPLHPLRRRCP
jgi:hypothetical protein